MPERDWGAAGAQCVFAALPGLGWGGCPEWGPVLRDWHAVSILTMLSPWQPEFFLGPLFYYLQNGADETSSLSP